MLFLIVVTSLSLPPYRPTHQNLLQELLERIYDSAVDTSPGKILVFCETKRTVDSIAHFINGFGERCGAIHGDKSQSDRDNTLRAFRAGHTNILVATDVAARGLDVDGIKNVINYDYPLSSEDYIHRIGRTGRRDTTGTSHTFFTEDNARQARDLVAVLREAKQVVDVKLQEFAERRFSGPQSGGYQRRHSSSSGGAAGGYRNNNNQYNQSYNRRNSWDGGGSNQRSSGGDSGYRPRYERRSTDFE